jgi:hypothetical protein
MLLADKDCIMPDTLDQLLSIGSTLDFISPIRAIIQDLTNGPHHRFYIDRYAGWSVNGIKRLLKDYGVQVWGDMIADDMIIFTVRQAQARWTQYLLQREGISILGGLIGPVDVAPLPAKGDSETEALFCKLDAWLDSII